MIQDDFIENGRELAEREKNRFLPNRNWEERDVSRFQLDMTKPLQKPQYLLAVNGVPFSILKGFLCITGQAGHGKTKTIALLIATILKGKVGNLTYEQKKEIPKPKVVYIDTEQEQFYTQQFAHIVCSMVGWEREQNHEQLQLFNLREEPDTNDRWEDIIKIIDTTRPTVVIIDGLLDVVNNQNEMDECAPIINECLAIATRYKLALWTVIHQNPNSNSKMSGNLGSMAERKAGDVMSTTKSKDEITGVITFEVKQLKARGKDIDNWLFRIDWNEEQRLALPCPIVSVMQTPEDKEEQEKQKLAEMFGKVNIGTDGICITKLKKRLGDKKSNAESETYRAAQKAIYYGIMSYSEVNKRYYYHGITNTKQPTQSRIEFEGQEPENNSSGDDNALPFPKESNETAF